MPLTPRRLNRATLARQLLLRREPLGVEGALRRVVALQAQEPASPYLALWNRVEGFDPVELDRAFADRSVVKATTVRITLHAVLAEDYPRFHDAMQPSLRASRLYDGRYRGHGLGPEDADDRLAAALAHAAEPRTNAEMEAFLVDRFGPTGKPTWWALRTFAPVVHAPVGGTWSFGPRPAYVVAPDHARPDDPDRSLAWLARRYLEGFGPATVQDLAGFAMVQVPRVRSALAMLADEGAAQPVDGPPRAELWDVPGALVPDEDTPAPPRLLGMWDSVLLAYKDRSRIIPPDLRGHVIRQNGDVLPTLLVDGAVAGVWRPLDGGIEATALVPLDDDTWAGLEAEARSLLAFLAPRDPAVYRRYGHWWARLPAGTTRILGR